MTMIRDDIVVAGRRQVWVNHFPYTRERLLGGGEVPWDDPAACVAYFGQCGKLLRSDACLFPLADFFAGQCVRDPALRDAMGQRRRSGNALKVMLGDVGVRATLASLATVLAAQSQVPLVLVLPASGDWMRVAHFVAHGDEYEADGEDVERAAMYVADFLRIFAASGVSGVLVAARGAGSLPPGAHQPLVNVAAHYRWNVGALDTSGAAGDGGLDFRVAPAGSGEALGRSINGASAALEVDAPLVYLSLSPDDVPENVLESLDALRGK